MKKTYSLLLLLLVSIIAMGGPVTSDQARQRVAKFMNPRRAGAISQDQTPLQLVSTSHYKAQDNTMVPSYYVFNVADEQGYVIAGADDRIPAVLGYSDRGSFDPQNIPSNMKAWLQGYSKQMAYLNRHPEAAAHRRTVEGDGIDPLLGTEWDQTSPYNDLCPMDGDVHSLTGCVATAMAQIMRFWKHPAATTDVIPGYTSAKIQAKMPDIAAGSPIDWDNMVLKYTGKETPAQQQAVANLMLMCGTAVQMDYSADFSGAFGGSVAAGLQAYFDYDLATSYELHDFYRAAEWNQKVYNELKAGRPVYYDGDSSGGGHAFVVDGYGGDDYFHVNWGWGGMSNDYFLLSILDPNNNTGSGASSSADGYSFGQGAIFGAQPNTGMSPTAEPVMSTNNMVLPDDSIFSRSSADEDFMFQVGFSYINCMSIPYKFDCGIGLFDSDGQLIKIVDRFPMEELMPRYGLWTPELRNIQLGKGLSNGIYFLLPMSHEQNSALWFLTKGYDIYNAAVIIEDNNMMLVGSTFGLTGSLAAESKKEVGSPMPVTASITNDGTAYLGEIFFVVNDRMKGGRHFDIEAQDTQKIEFSFIPDSIGRYEVAVCTRSWNADDEKYDYVPFIKDSIDVGTAAAADLTVALSVENATKNVVTENAIKAKVTITNKGASVYDNDIQAILYKDGHDGSGLFYWVKTLKQTVNIEGGQTTDLLFNFDNLEDDRYLISISYFSEGEWLEGWKEVYTVQTREPDPAPVLSTSAQTMNAVRDNGSFIVKTDTAVVSILVKNTGNLDYDDDIIVNMYKLTTETGGPLVATGRQPIQLAVGKDTTIVMEFPDLEDGATYFYWTYYIANGDFVEGSSYSPIFTIKLEEQGYYMVSDLNSWSTTDQSWPFTKLADGKTWEITFPASNDKFWMKIAPASAYEHQDDFWSRLLCAPKDSWTELSGSMVINGGAWLLTPSLNAETYTMRINPDEMTYEITYTEQPDGILFVDCDHQSVVTIYSLKGNKLAEVRGTNLQKHLQSLPKGIYIVRTAQQSRIIRN